jgi:protein-disulfide isomerase
MKNAIVIGTLGVVISFAMLAFGFLAGSGNVTAAVPQTMAARDAGNLDRAEIGQIVREYLVENPDVLVEVQAALQTKRDEERRVAQEETLKSQSDLIYNAKYDGLIGNPDGKVTIVEFFDYNCTFCRHALPDMEKLVEDNPDLRFIMKEFPILGPDSQKAHVVSMAFRALAPEKYAEFHQRLLGAQGRATEASAIRVALSLGVDEAALREAMKNPQISAEFDETYELANKLEITGTPSYIVGQEVVFGALGHQVLAQKIAAARESCATASC